MRMKKNNIKDEINLVQISLIIKYKFAAKLIEDQFF